MEYLASDELEGRMTGSEGARLAAEYIAQALRATGLEPFGDDGTYFQTFEFTADRRILPEANTLRVETGDASHRVDADFRPLSFTANADVQGEVVFAGYGLAVPGTNGYDSYAGLDVTDKVVLVLRYVPEGVDAERRAELNRYAGLRYKAMIARDRGAKAILIVAGPNSPNAGKLIPMTFDNSLAGSGIVAASVSGAVADALFAGAGKSLEETQSQLDIENPHFLGQFPLDGVEVAIRTGVERIKATDRNVLAWLPATDESAVETVVVGAHYDHIGRGDASSLAGKDEEGEIHNGADDNASGVAVALELARKLAEREERRRNVLFAFWSGEELGLIGSSHFVETPPLPPENIAAYVNFDMVGRLRDNKLSLQGVGSSSIWRGLIERRNVPGGLQPVPARRSLPAHRQHGVLSQGHPDPELLHRQPRGLQPPDRRPRHARLPRHAPNRGVRRGDRQRRGVERRASRLCRSAGRDQCRREPRHLARLSRHDPRLHDGSRRA